MSRRRLHTLPEGITLQHRWPAGLSSEWALAVWHFRQLLRAAFSADVMGDVMGEFHEHPAHSEITGESGCADRIGPAV